MSKPAMKILLSVFIGLGSLSLSAQPGGNSFPGNCDCDPADFAPVCVSDEEGNTFIFESACLAQCFGLEVLDDENCDLINDFPGDGGDPDPFPCDCDPNVFEPVCVDDGMGNVIPFPNACIAECEGLEIVGEGDCEFGGGDPGNGGGGFPGDDPFDCDCEPNFEEPVCAVDDEGITHVLPGECIANCLGFDVLPAEECDLGGGDPDPFPCDCDPNILEPVCVVDEEGNTFPFENACLAECVGLTVVEGDCDFDFEPEPFPCDCDPNVLDPVCVEEEEGNVFVIESACIAECFGLTVVDGDCDFGGENPGDGGDFPIEDPFDCDCDFEEEEQICVEDEDGNVFPFFSTCVAECIGLTVVDGDCGIPDFPGDNPGDNPGDIECDCEQNYDPVCVIVEGMVALFPNACVAECLGFEVVGNGDCFEEFPFEGMELGGNPNEFMIADYQGASPEGEEINIVDDLNMYPNPVTDNLSVNFEKTSEEIVSVEVLNTAGQRVIASKQVSAAGVHRLMLNIEDLQSGIYFLKISSNNAAPVTKKIFKK